MVGRFCCLAPWGGSGTLSAALGPWSGSGWLGAGRKDGAQRPSGAAGTVPLPNFRYLGSCAGVFMKNEPGGRGHASSLRLCAVGALPLRPRPPKGSSGGSARLRRAEPEFFRCRSCLLAYCPDGMASYCTARQALGKLC
jgi:hypothetical protein